MSKPQREDEVPAKPSRRLAIWQPISVGACAYVLILVVVSEEMAVGWRVAAGVVMALLIGSSVYGNDYAAPMTVRKQWVMFALLTMLPLTVVLFLFVACFNGLGGM